eukprot:scaffold97172_cov48-Attheya_sp.AAC.1
MLPDLAQLSAACSKQHVMIGTIMSTIWIKQSSYPSFQPARGKKLHPSDHQVHVPRDTPPHSSATRSSF